MSGMQVPGRSPIGWRLRDLVFKTPEKEKKGMLGAPQQRWTFEGGCVCAGVPASEEAWARLAVALYRGVLRALPATAMSWFGSLRDRALAAQIEVCSANPPFILPSSSVTWCAVSDTCWRANTDTQRLKPCCEHARRQPCAGRPASSMREGVRRQSRYTHSVMRRRTPQRARARRSSQRSWRAWRAAAAARGKRSTSACARALQREKPWRCSRSRMALV